MFAYILYRLVVHCVYKMHINNNAIKIGSLSNA